jgi:ADP-dependent NAD(P)H-hydrate dehydratase / NAD(P)H-hydrate epimerase
MNRTPPSLPRRVLPAQTPWPLFDVVTSRAIERRELALHPGGALMRRAGTSVARLALALAPHARRVWVAAGPGGNGGDGLHAAAQMQKAGREVVVTLLAARDKLPADAQAGLHRAEQAGVSIIGHPPGEAFDLLIDALLGIGAQRAPAAEMAATILALNASGSPCLSVDLPSGLSADSGAAFGDAVVRADATLSLLTLKPGLFTASGRDHAGAVWFDALDATIEAGESPVARLTSPADWHAASPPRRHQHHKGSFGDVIVVGGAVGMQGAARLAAHGALGAGAGRTIVSLLDVDAPLGDASRPEWLWQRAAWLPGAADIEHSTVVCGCGGDMAVRATLPAILSRSARLVLDADALNAVAADPSLQALLRSRAARGHATVLTPHPLEAARLLGSSTAAIQAGRLGSAQTIADRFGATVVLKGSGTVIAAPAVTPAINSTGNAALATGGTGDVLAGWIAGLWSQAARREEASATAIAFSCAAASVWLHGLAAEWPGASALRARDLVDAMREAAARL